MTVTWPVPTLEDNPVDGEAVCAALAKEGLEVKPTHLALSKIQHILAKNDRTVVCVVRDDAYIVDVWPPVDFDIYGAAIDVGSTSVALYVYNLCTGDLVYEKAAMNPQIRYGEDLMSRVSYIMMNKGGEHRLTEEIRKQVSTMLKAACEDLSLGDSQLLEITMVGNPIMHHLFNGFNPVELGVAPFTLAVKDWLDVPAAQLGLEISSVARISWFPLIGGHVGADTTAAYLTQMDDMQDRSVLLVDIGTNAEIVLSHKGKIAAASSPTGPALEGAEHTITGICGSGIFEVMVELADAGLLDQSGLFIPDAAPARFSQDGNVWKYCLVNREKNPIFIKQTDIRAVQLAKAALYAGAQLLAESLECEAFDEVLLAGAFGTHLDGRYVADIGIVPMAPKEIIRSIGNAAGTGAAMALLNVNEKRKIIEGVKVIEKMETATEPKFQDYFVDAMKFPTAPMADPEAAKSRRGRGGRRNRSRTQA